VATRSADVAAAPRPATLALNDLLADAPEPAAVGESWVVLMTVLLLFCWRNSGALGILDGGWPWRPSAVVPVVAELVLVDVDAQTRALADQDGAVLDDQRLGEQVVAHVEEVGQLTGAARGGLVSGAECRVAHRADLAVDLVSDDHLDAESFAQVVDALGVGESGARGFDGDTGRRAAEDLPGHIGGPGHALVGVD